VKLYLGHEGFLKLCFEKKYPVIPVFTRGENRMFLVCSIVRSLREKFSHWTRCPLPTFFLGPFPVEITGFVAKAIQPGDDFVKFKNDYSRSITELINENEDKRFLSPFSFLSKDF